MFGVVCGTNRSVASTWVSYVLLGAIAAFAGCAGETPTESGEELVDQTPPFDALTHFISNPVPLPSAGGGTSASVDDHVSYVSLPPETYPNGVAADIGNAANGYETSVSMVNGGFDPVPVPSAVGDTLQITIKNAEGETIGLEGAPVPADAPPLIVRTRPTKSKDFVPLNLVAAVVFSEPVDGSTVTAQTIQIRHGGVDGVQVAGTVVLQANGIVAEFVTAAPLESDTEYTLVVTTGIRDLSGDALPNQEVVSFATLGIAAYVVVDNGVIVADTTGGCGCTWHITRTKVESNQVAVIDTKTHTLATTIEFDGTIWSDVDFVPGGQFAYLSGSSYVTVVDAVTHSPADVLVGLQSVSHLTWSLGGQFAYVLQDGEATGWATDLVMVSTENHEVVERFSLVNGESGAALAVSPDGSDLYAATARYNFNADSSWIDFSIQVVDATTNSKVATMALPGPVSQIRFSPDGAIAYASQVGFWSGDAWTGDQSRIYVIDTADLDIVATIETGRRGEEIVMTRDGAYLLVSSEEGGITVIDTATNSVVGRIGSMRSSAMLLTRDGSRLYAADPWSRSLWVIDVASMSVVTQVPVDIAPYLIEPGGGVAWDAPGVSLAVTPDGAFVYVGGANATVTVIDAATSIVVAEIDVGGPIKDIAITSR